MKSATTMRPRGFWHRTRRGVFVGAATLGVLMFMMRDTVAHKIVQVDNTQELPPMGQPMEQMPPAAEQQPYEPNLPAQWSTDFDEAKARAAESGKPVLAVFSAEWCAPCQTMIRDIYPKQEVISALSDWEPVYVDGDVHQDLVSEYEIEGFPTFIAMNADGEEQGRFVGGAGSAETFLVRLDTSMNYDEKLAEAEREVSENPEDAEALHRLGDLKMANVEDNESFMEAVKVYKKAIAANPNDTGNVEPELVEVLKQSVANDRQIETISRQIESSPEDAALYKERADLKSDDPLALSAADAIGDYRKAKELDPDNETGAAGELKFLEIREGLTSGQTDPAEALAELQRFEEENPESKRVPDSLILRAFINLQTGQMAVGSQLLNTLIEEYPDHEAADSAREVLAQIQGMNAQPGQPQQGQPQQGQPQQGQPQPNQGQPNPNPQPLQ